MEQTTKDYFIRKIESNNINQLNYHKLMSNYLLLGLVNIGCAANVLLQNNGTALGTAATISAGVGLLGCLSLMSMTAGEHYNSQETYTKNAEKARVYTRQLQRQIKL